MSATKIEWADETWNPTTGCDRVSPGCDNCYALTMAPRLKAMGDPKYQADGDPRTSGPGFGLTVHPHTLDAPLHWRKPRRVFVNSMSDLFHDQVPDAFILHTFAIMALADSHTFQVLTKRPGRMASLLGRHGFADDVQRTMTYLVDNGAPVTGAKVSEIRGRAGAWLPLTTFPLRNVWLGTSVESQKWADVRIPKLLETPAAVRFLSCEPLLGPVDLVPPLKSWADGRAVQINQNLHWVIVGGESGRGARPMHPDWARTLRDQCAAAAVPFFFKQWGAWGPSPGGVRPGDVCLSADGFSDTAGTDYVCFANESDGETMRLYRSKEAAGRELDGRTWDEYPQPEAVPA